MSLEKCMICDDTINSDEALIIDGVWYHHACFKCSQCDEILLENEYSSSDGILYCKPHFEQKFNKSRRLPRRLSLPRPSELRKTPSILSSIFFKPQAKRIVSRLPPSEKKEVRQKIPEANDDSGYASDATNQIQSLSSAGGESDQQKIMNLFIHNPAFSGLLAQLSNQNEIESQDFLGNMLEQLTQNPELMSTINQLGQMGGNQDLGSIFAATNDSHGIGDLDMSFMFQHMMPIFPQALHHLGSSSNLLEHNPPAKVGLHRRCYSDSTSINGLSMDCQMNLKEAAQKIEDDYPPLEIFSSLVESAALLHDHVYDAYGLADLCSEEELAKEFMEMLKRDVCRRLGKRYDCSFALI